MSELMDAGFNPAAVSGRQGQTVQVMLHHYSTRRQSSGKAAAEHLGQRIHGRSAEKFEVERAPHKMYNISRLVVHFGV
jgi:hypothetical protein